MTIPAKLLDEDEPHPVRVSNPQGGSAFLLACDHAGRRLPARLGDLGLPPAEFDRHIAYDIGIAWTSHILAEALDAVLIEQLYSRLVIDCNRPPDTPSSVPAVSETTTVPGNVELSGPERQARIDEIFRPYHERLAEEIDARLARQQPTVLIAMHSFTPVYKGEARPWHIGTLYGRDGRLARPLYDLLCREDGIIAGDNQPYAVSDETDYTIPVHGERRGLVHVGIEIRQDLITEPDGQARWAERLARLLPQALAALDARPPV